MSFYTSRHGNTIYAAEKIIDIVLSVLPPVNTALDIGCGVGTWTSILHKRNIAATGFDGAWVPQKYLQTSDFTTIEMEEDLVNFESSLWRTPKVDLIVTLEVAEHLPEHLADIFCAFITAHCDYVLFSAAIPGQTGDGHVNEQWPTYWSEKFSKQGFVFYDLIRKKIWVDEKIPFWYRQNCFLGIKKGLSILPKKDRLHPGFCNIVHPEQFNLLQRNMQSTRIGRLEKYKNILKNILKTI